MKTVYIKDYVSLPCDDATKGIMKAIEDAKQTDAQCIEFEAGVYKLKQSYKHKTDQTAHDAGADFKEFKDVHLLFSELENIKITGIADENNNPLTILEGYNNMELNTLLPSILWVDGGENISISNFKLRRNPEFCSCGKVVDIVGDKIFLEVFEGNPCYDNMGTYCMNRFTSNGELFGNSLSFGNGLDVNFRLVNNNTLSLDSEDIANKVAIGDIITFHQGAKTDFQCFFGNIKNLRLENIHTTNANGFAHLAFNINNLTVRNVKFKPENNMHFTAPRDAFKLHKCSGIIDISDMEIEGVRMDGQNIHSNYLFIEDIISDDTIKFFTRYAYLPLKDGSNMEFYIKEEKALLKINSWEHNGSGMNNGYYGQYFTVTFDKKIPFDVDKSILCLASCWEADEYICKNSSFKNIAGAGHLSRTDNMRITNCSYKNMMNSGILLGAEFPTHTEGGHATDIVIKNCVFDNCGNTARYDAKGCIGIKSHGLSGPNNKDITIENCIFKNSDIGIDIHDSDNVLINQCVFENIAKNVRIENDTCKNIKVVENN